MSDVEARLKQRGHVLTHPPAAVGAYVPCLRSGSLVITSGQLPFVGRELAFVGKIGAELHEQQGSDAAVICVVNALAQIKACIGDLDQIRRIVRLEGYVQSGPGFHNQPLVLNAASELLADVFGETGRHTRVAVGVNELPLNAPIEIALWAEV